MNFVCKYYEMYNVLETYSIVIIIDLYIGIECIFTVQSISICIMRIVYFYRIQKIKILIHIRKSTFYYFKFINNE